MITKIFTDHPTSVGETYVQHMMFAAKFSATLLVAASAALVHAIIPCLCEKTASRMVANLYAKTHNRGQ